MRAFASSLGLSAALLLVGVPTRVLCAQGASLPPQVEMRVPMAPTVAAGEGGSFLAYELHLTNFSSKPAMLRKVEVRTTGQAPRVLLALADSALLHSIWHPGHKADGAERPTLGGGQRAVVFLWVAVDGGAPPVRLRHRVTLAEGSGDSVHVQTADGAEVDVRRDVAIIGPPLRGGPWLAGNGPSNESGHRRALVVANGTAPTIAQRFAIDYVKVDDRYRTFRGDSLKNASYYAEGNEALAVADGRVVEVKDGIPENVPGVDSRAVPINLETVAGNHVIIDIANGRYAFYAHLKTGSIRVREGDRVRRGQAIGLVGNTGNSTEPHLHFHLSDANSPLGSEGIPYGYDTFELVGRCRSLLGPCERSAAAARHNEIPLENALVRFPQ